MEIINRKIKDLIPYDKNPRKNDEAVKYVKASIEQFGFKVPIVIDADGVIVAGHTRLKAAKELGMEEVPCIVADDLNEEQIKAFRLADNKTAEIAEWDIELLNTELLGLESNFDMSDFGFDIYLQTDEVSDEDFDADAVAEAITEPVTKPGDVWALGSHRVMCGDSTKPEDFEKLMADTKAVLVITDPPYNVNYGDKAEMLEEYLDKGHKNTSRILNDDMGDQEFRQLLTDAFTRAYEAMVPGAPIYVFHAETEGINFREAFKDAGFKLSQCLIWVKSAFVLGRQDYHWRHEPILYGWKEGEAHRWYGDRNKDTAILEECPGVTVKQTKKGDLITFTDGLNTVSIRAKEYEIEDTNTVIYHERPSRSEDHPTMKPVGLIVKLLRNSSKRGDVVLDPFGGSGSTLIACEEQKCACYMMELDPKYCDVIVKRWETLTGQKAVLLNG